MGGGEGRGLKLHQCTGKEKKPLLKAKHSGLSLCVWGLNNGSFLFPRSQVHPQMVSANLF